MSDDGLLLERLTQIFEALERIPRRFENITSLQDFYSTYSGLEHLDSICMVLLAVGESFKQINQKTEGSLLGAYPQIPWQEIMGLRNILAHVYFEVDEQQIYNICRDNIPQLIKTVRQMIQDLDN
ncbi:DUF86 domain-containing protein [Nodosilinea sp. LEGE 06152]|uniref:HepT-like ribonuclease domain-containing protein n=1 Tax=Nodosilinea sp. LEGE 06152 TaxID=2777966 RepID=UPI001881B992|nr:HepT-like ribonuclease domain-containing protein [Nodosilinea sp. LEGE 06152]MBE9155444.1 DUF86 domain-containing protein [Nodosilinea sp. LEGE 06152]